MLMIMFLLNKINQANTMKAIMKAACLVSIPIAILVDIMIGTLAQVLALAGVIRIQDGACHLGMDTHIIIALGIVLIMGMGMDTDMIMVGMVIILITMIIIIRVIIQARAMLRMVTETLFHRTVIMEEEVPR